MKVLRAALLELAELAAAHAQMPVSIAEAPARVFDPGHFVGDPARAAALLGWRSEIEIEEGLAQLIASDVRELRQSSPQRSRTSLTSIDDALGKRVAAHGSHSRGS